MTTERIRELNDAFRTTFRGGRVLITAGVQGRGAAFVETACQAVKAFTAFTPDNDPHGEHDFASVMVEGQKVYFKIDYYEGLGHESGLSVRLVGTNPESRRPAARACRAGA